MNIFSKLLSLDKPCDQKRQESMPATMVAKYETVDKVYYAVYLSSDNTFRVCTDLITLQQSIQDLVRVALGQDARPNNVLTVFKSDLPGVFPLGAVYKSLNNVFFNQYTYFSVDIQVAMALYLNGLCTPGYLMSWYKKDWSSFDKDFLNSLGLKAADGSYKFSIRELEQYFANPTSVFPHTDMFAYLKGMTDPDSAEMESVINYLSVNVTEENIRCSIRVVDTMSESPALKGMLGGDDDLLHQAEYLSSLDLKDINPFQNIFMFAHLWYTNKVVLADLEEQLNIAEENVNELARLFPDMPEPLWLQKIHYNLKEDRAYNLKVSDILGNACACIEESCRLADEEDKFNEYKKYITHDFGTAVTEGTSLFVTLNHLFNQLSIPMVQRIAGLLLDSDYISKDPVSCQCYTEALMVRYAKSVSKYDHRYFSMSETQKRMPNLDNLTRLYVMAEREVIVNQINNKSEYIRKMEKQYSESLTAGNTDDVLSIRIEDEKQQLDDLREREDMLFELARQLVEQEPEDYSNDAQVLMTLSRSVGQKDYVLTDAETHVLRRYGLFELADSFLHLEQSGDQASHFRLMSGTDFLRETFRLLASLVSTYADKGYYFYSWGITPYSPYKPSLFPEDYKTVLKSLPLNECYYLDSHPLFSDCNLNFINEYNYIRKVGPCADANRDNPVDYQRVLGLLASRQADDFVNIFSDPDAYRSLCGESLIKDGFESYLIKLIGTRRSLASCTSIIQREMLQKSLGFSLDKLASLASALLNKDTNL